ncbi:MAG: cell division protein SepF [Erysipelotrichaceae bacterium]|jgi:cell division inhibitor SepF|nr:cell division protein SepF [Erysipelotrichaceae bacterium]
MKNFSERIKDFIAPVDESETELELSSEEAKAVTGYEKAGSGKVVIDSSIKIVNFEPRSYEEAEEVGSQLKEKRACVVNLHRLPDRDTQRMVDFLSGVIFAINGTIKKVGDNVILCSPKEMGVSGDINLNSNEDYDNSDY